MKVGISVLTAACALALAACGNNNSSSNGGIAPATTAPEAASTAAMPMTAPATSTGMDAMTSATSTAMAGEAMPGSSAQGAAVVTNCSTEFDATDSMQYSISSITVPASCTDFKITLKHTGHLPVSTMGHDVVITSQSDMQAVDAAGAKAGLKDGYVQPGDARVIAHTKLIGGGETASVSFPVSKIKDGGPYVFFCSFPGHSSVMHGTITVSDESSATPSSSG